MIDTPAPGFEDFDIRPGLHGRRKGKKLRAHQSDLCETLLPRLKLDMSQPIDFQAAADFNRFFYMLTGTVADAAAKPVLTK